MRASTRRKWPFFAISVLGLLVGLWGMTRLLPRISPFHFAVILLEGLLFVAASLIVFAPRAERGPLRDLYFGALLFGVAVMIHDLDLPRARALGDWLLPAIRIGCLTALPVLFFRMTQTFPRRRKLLDRYPGLMRALWIGALALAAWQIAAAYHDFLSPTPGARAWRTLPRSIAEVTLALALGLGSLTLYRTGRALDLAREREQIRWMLWGLAIGVAPNALLRAFPRLVGLDTGVPPELERLFEMAIPLAFAFAILRPKFLDIDIIIRKSVIYLGVAGALAAIYYLVGVVLAFRLPAVALVALLVTPARRWIERGVDRLFFRLQYRYARALLHGRDEIRSARSQEEILERTRLFVESELPVTAAVLLARRGAVILVSASGPWPHDAGPVLSAASTRPDGTTRRPMAAPGSTMRPDLEHPSFPTVLRAAGITLALVLEDGSGALLVGERTNGRPFTEEDLRLLYAVRAEMGRALDRVASVQRAYDEILRPQSPPRTDDRMGSPVAVHADRVDLLPLVQEAVQEVEPAARARRIRFEVSVSPHVRAVAGDRDLLFEIVTDLLENAAHYSPDGEPVEVTIEPTRIGQMLIIRDRGPGIAESERERIFQRVEPGRSSTIQAPGHGLRLYVARLHLETMGGTIHARNHPEGGAMFVCTMPAFPEDAAPLADSEIIGDWTVPHPTG